MVALPYFVAIVRFYEAISVTFWKARNTMLFILSLYFTPLGCAIIQLLIAYPGDRGLFLIKYVWIIRNIGTTKGHRGEALFSNDRKRNCFHDDFFVQYVTVTDHYKWNKACVSKLLSWNQVVFNCFLKSLSYRTVHICTNHYPFVIYKVLYFPMKSITLKKKSNVSGVSAKLHPSPKFT